MTTPDPDQPTNVVAVLRDGRRIPLSLRHIEVQGDIHYWEPVIEGDIRKLMPQMVAVDAEYWPNTAAIRFPDEQSCTEQWGEAIAANSAVVDRYEPNYDYLESES